METTTNYVQNATKVASKWAFIYTAAAIIITYALQFLNVDQTSYWKFISYIPFIGFLFLAQKEYRDVLGGYISFGNAFSAGFRYAVFTGLLVAVFTYIYFAFLSPQEFDKLLDTMQTAMQEKGAPSAQVDKFMSFYKSWGYWIFAFSSAIGSAITGAIIALIGAAIFKKEMSPYDLAQNAVDPTQTEV